MRLKTAAVAVLLGLVIAASSSTAAGGSPTLLLITEPNQGYGPIDSLLASPRRTLDLTMYELEDVTAERILAADAARGVDVRVLLDREYVGSSNQEGFGYLAARGVHVRWASTRVALTHEKTFVIDSDRAVIMTGNLTSRYYSSTRDFALVDRKPADVSAIERVFDLDWDNRAGTPTDGADLIWSPGSESTLVGLIGSARRSVLIENEEMDAASIVDALEGAAQRGVDVDVTMTRSSEWDDAFGELVKAGVHVHTLSPYASLYIHAKVIDVDDSRAFVGSENFSVESMDYNRELGVVTSDPEIVNAITATLKTDYQQAQPWRP